MAVPNTELPTLLPARAQQQIVSYLKSRVALYTSFSDIRAQMEIRDQAYQRERDTTEENKQGKEANKRGDFSKLKNFEVPVVMPQVESAVVYQSSVFLSGTPLFGVTASPQFMDEALAVETEIDSQAREGGWTRELILAFRKAFKYGVSPVEVIWHKEVQLATGTDYTEGPAAAQLETIWAGNKIRSLDAYNTFYDTRVPPAECYKRGEFIGYTDVMSHVELKDYIQKLPARVNVTEAFNSSVVYDNYYIPQVNQSVSQKQIVESAGGWDTFAGLTPAQRGLHYKDIYQVTNLYARILPSQFGIPTPGQNTPQIWRFVVINGSVVVYAEKLVNSHNQLPILLMQPLEDGLGLQTKSLAENVEVVQDVTSSLISSVISARRMSVHGRTLYDSSRINKSQIESGKSYIPVRGALNEQPISSAVFPFPFRDDQSGTILQEHAQFYALANVITGQNPARGGQFVKGNKTRSEFDTVMSNANGRDQLCSLLIEDQFMTPMKRILLSNILQFSSPKELYSQPERRQVTLDPIKLRQAILHFKVTDGLTPSDKMANTSVYVAALQALSSSPQIANEYMIAPLFSYITKLQGGDLRPFEKPPEIKAYEQAVGAWQQTVIQLAKDNPDITPDKYPPQPKPADYNIGPDGKPIQQQGAQQNV